MRVLVLAAAVVFVGLWSSPAGALTQPNGTAIPGQTGCNNNQPAGLLPVFACACTQSGVCNIGSSCTSSTSCDNGQHGTCESTMWHSFNDNTCIPSNHSGLDPWTGAAITPETFHPTCAQTYTVLSRGTALFKNVFGWYNAGTSTPDPTDLHVMLDCNSTPGTSVVLDLTKEPTWKGGDVAFFLITPEDHGASEKCANGNCCASVANFQSGAGYAYYSQREFNPDGQGSNPFIHLLIYPSDLTNQKYYFGWEDTYQTTNADFTDLVTSVSGIDCTGAGLVCNTGKLGICAQGVTECGMGTQVSCVPIFQPTPEKCNGVDDNCDGQIDNGATCPVAGDVCYNGKCVPHCGSLEFPCSSGTACDSKTGLCVDPRCVGVTCPVGKICQAGVCDTPCSGVVCPHGQTCVGTACIDLCDGVTCAPGEVCAEGGCVAGCGMCGGPLCTSPLTCDSASGACADPSCPNGCGAGNYCSSGSCIDDCTGAHCPAGQACKAGQCIVASMAPDAGGGIASPDASVDGSVDVEAGYGDDDGGATNGGSGASFGGSTRGCGCSLVGDNATATPLGLAVALALGWLRRRRAGARRARG